MNVENGEIRRQELLEMANNLHELEQVQNNGRGVTCVKDVITLLRQGDFDKAKLVATHDHDKIGAYLDIESLMETYGLCESYKTFRDKLNKI